MIDVLSIVNVNHRRSTSNGQWLTAQFGSVDLTQIHFSLVWPNQRLDLVNLTR